MFDPVVAHLIKALLSGCPGNLGRTGQGPGAEEMDARAWGGFQKLSAMPQGLLLKILVQS